MIMRRVIREWLQRPRASKTNRRTLTLALGLAALPAAALNRSNLRAARRRKAPQDLPPSHASRAVIEFVKLGRAAQPLQFRHEPGDLFSVFPIGVFHLRLHFPKLRRCGTSTNQLAALTVAKPPMGGAPKARADLSPLAERG